MRRLFEISNSEFSVIVPGELNWIVSPGNAVAMRSRKVPAPLSARLVTVSGVENACGEIAAATNITGRNAQALENINVPDRVNMSEL